MANDNSIPERIGNGFASLLMAAVALTLLAGVGINFANILARYFFSTPFHWVEEVMTFMLVWITFLAVGAIAWDDKHLSIDLFVPTLPRALRFAVVLSSMLATIGISAIMLQQSSKMVSTFLNNSQTSLVAQVQMEIPHGVIPVGFAMVILLVSLRIVTQRLSIGRDVTEDVLEDLDLKDVIKSADQDNLKDTIVPENLK